MYEWSLCNISNWDFWVSCCPAKGGNILGFAIVLHRYEITLLILVCYKPEPKYFQLIFFIFHFSYTNYTKHSHSFYLKAKIKSSCKDAREKWPKKLIIRLKKRILTCKTKFYHLNLKVKRRGVCNRAQPNEGRRQDLDIAGPQASSRWLELDHIKPHYTAWS